MACRAHHCRVELTQLKAAPPQHTRALTHAQCECDSAPHHSYGSAIIAPSSVEAWSAIAPPTGTVKLAEGEGEQEHSVPVRVLINDCLC